MEYYEYYEGLNAPQLLREHSEIIIQNEAAWYCESNGEEFIQYCELRTKSNESSKMRAKREITNEEFERKITMLSNPVIPLKNRPFARRRRKVKGKKQSRLYTDIIFIQKDNERRRAEKLIQIAPNERSIPNDRKTESCRHIVEPSVAIGDSATLEVTKAKDVSKKKPEIKPNPPGVKILKVGGKEIKN